VWWGRGKMTPTTSSGAVEADDESMKTNANESVSVSARLHRRKYAVFVMCKFPDALVLITLSALVLSSPPVLDAFNLEPRIPVVKRGTEGSYFGYSVAMHQSVDPITNADLDSWYVHFPSSSFIKTKFLCSVTKWPNSCSNEKNIRMKNTTGSKKSFKETSFKIIKSLFPAFSYLIY
jgi:hypothetical protein